MTNIAIFVSGNGTNCENIINYFKNNKDINVCLVISNKAEAYALKRATKHGIPCKVLSKQEINDNTILIPLLEDFDINFIVLAGFMLMVPGFVTEKYEHKIVNRPRSSQGCWRNRDWHNHTLRKQHMRWR